MRDEREKIATAVNKIMELESALNTWKHLPLWEWPFDKRNAVRRLARWEKRLAALKGE